MIPCLLVLASNLVRQMRSIIVYYLYIFTQKYHRNYLIRFKFRWVINNAKLRSYYNCAEWKGSRIKDFTVCNFGYSCLVKKDMKRVFFYWENKGKSKVSISTELHEQQKLYWATNLTGYNIQKLFKGLLGIK